MTYETKQKADELCEKIEEAKDCIYRLNLRISNASDFVQANIPSRDKTRKSPLMMRLLNRNAHRAKEEKKKEGAEIIIFDNIGIYGTDIDVDKEIVDAIVSVYKKRLSELEKEFAELG